MSLQTIFDSKNKIDQFLSSYLSLKRKELSTINGWGSDSVDKLIPFLTAGKGVRGCLCTFCYLLFSQTKSYTKALPLAAALELIHTGALIHDDIMDQDTHRRHLPTMHMQYKSISANPHFGESMAINLGNLCYFLAFELLSQTDSPNRNNIIALASREFTAVTIAQQFDVASSYTTHISTLDEIISLYKTKTARYTFSLPLMCAAMLANTNSDAIHLLESFGESLGILFQIRDDELGIIGDSKKIGKSIGIDKINNTQTLIQYYLRHFKETEYTNSKSYDMVQSMKNKYTQHAKNLIEQLDIKQSDKLSLYALITFCGSRET